MHRQDVAFKIGIKPGINSYKKRLLESLNPSYKSLKLIIFISLQCWTMKRLHMSKTRTFFGV